ncbi:glycosyltransferase family 4 protein [Sphingobium bisphenolivorans]|uniref:glycosyltransferase family 4 protein n=1 Tax=Sphingobium bisphenolivorans TaxID=1335760 RepID=UPI00039A381D|nr:glycosyltransferase family 4 protein [Sphingobium bisphenolivorans]
MSRHILFVISSLGAGGAERVIAQLASHMIGRGDRVSVVSFDRPSDPIYHDFPQATRFVRLGGDLEASALRTLRRILTLRRTIAGLAPDIVISFLTKINVIALAATIGMPVPVIISERNNMARQPMHFLWRKAAATLFPRARAIVLQTAASAAMLPAGARRKAVVIGNPITRFPWTPAGLAATRLTAVGRLTDQKGFDTLIDAFARVAPHHPGWALDIWGEGPDEAALRARIGDQGLGGRVRLAGLSERPAQWIESSSIFILSSRYEGFPNVLGEAMAAALPVIATDCAFGPAELVQHGENGLLVPVDDPAALGGAMLRLIENAELAIRLGASAAGVAEAYSPRAIAGRWDEVIDACLTPLASRAGRQEQRAIGALAAGKRESC